MDRKRGRASDGSSNGIGHGNNGVDNIAVIDRLDDLVHPDFEELARRFPKFGQAWRDTEQTRKQSHNSKLSLHITQDFSLNLTKALLHVYFSVSLTNFPDQQHLCPPVPNRYFYVTWIRDHLLPMIQNSVYYDDFQTIGKQTIKGLDIGTGAFAIYPLLFCSSSSSSSSHHSILMYGTDVDEIAIQYARANVQSNPRIADRIQIIQVPTSDRQQQERQHQGHEDNENMQDDADETTTIPVGPLRRSMESMLPNSIDFCMTNPPFFDIHETIPQRADHRPRTHMTVSEGCYPGGEVGFVIDMIVDSAFLYIQNASNKSSYPPPPDWCSCMCGKKSSFVFLKHVLEQILGGPGHVQSTEFGPGQLTRWFLAWTFRRPNVRSPLSQLSTWSFDVENTADTTEVIQRIREYANEFPKQHALVCEEKESEDKSGVVLHMREASTTLPPWSGDDALPEPLRTMVQQIDPAMRLQFLPPEGHFLLIFHVRLVSPQKQPPQVTVTVEPFQHSSLGNHIIEKIKSQLASDVRRTSRRWRRRMQRVADPSLLAMDES